MKHKVHRIHFVGIGGAGMSGIAEVLLNLGYQVSGSDAAGNAATRRLAGMGAEVFQGHAAGNMVGADVLVVSSAIKQDNPEVQAARAAHIPVVARAMMLAELMRFKKGVAIAGTHGKTTTTSLIASVLAEAGLDPTFVIGGKLLAAGANAKLGSGEWLVAEADESDASFLHLSPAISVVTNIDVDHMETYGHDFERLKSAFVDFLHRLPFWGMAVLCADDPVVRELLPRIEKPVMTYGSTDDCTIQAVNIRVEDGRMAFTALRNGARSPIDIRLNLPGMHNVLNALAAIGVAWELQIPDAAVQRALAGFSGVGRRFQRYGEIELADGRRFTLIDDYGHHPVEMRATLAAARDAFPGRRLVLAFQPHRYTRTRDLFEDFVQVLSLVDALLLTEVYAASETAIVAADGRSLARAVRVAGRVEPVFVPEVTDLPAAIADFVQNGDVVLTMGAGSVGQVPIKLAALGACQT
ncbi:MAG: UDP-N-acetylmuramate--L-alanine ligase [Hydrogenophilales bacterium CG03_land_8_20_14_0_80_62_28]|nr:UDP-N-acetylmuramate--L-alanine ligase [Betaproteobacteria bacterium]OIO77339.1 MAG: UDP-N-acetylmuramate--L-alanine ligase [Hydrogenophilaceae bacterium CG1_02_62_390]PIV21889.1 MAG: UDP-N-acetylmuramate--L-alanine ligase [Hydrogenophilales bacterium CG03_land_8_20_14_0_80_62_28]PIW38955.1 MAG: UDP-N-acetylmuramate--L-alanine ligase [Hydrogenophilales bacterium CG15_BIG_FIL_POST_REV_8_21_14_020_62_31]PIW72973.1 MAG: UDP-N-acetylmuramate--L-alanine ligase [Hydrogenophilales bacterium CG12_bi